MTQIHPPIARIVPTETPLHGVTLTDNYAWLRDKQNPDVTAYLNAENEYAEAFMAPLNGLREELYQEMLSHIKQTDISVPSATAHGGITPAPKKASSTPSTAVKAPPRSPLGRSSIQQRKSM